MSRLGEALSKFHQASIRESEFNVENILMKMDGYCSQLKSFGIDISYHVSLLNRLDKLKDYTSQTHITKTLKGLDVRNILIDKSGRLFLLDPGRMKEGNAYGRDS